MGDLRGQVLPLLARIDATLTATLPTLATKAELTALGSELRDEIGTLRTAVTAETGALRTAIARLPRRGEICAHAAESGDRLAVQAGRPRG